MEVPRIVSSYRTQSGPEYQFQEDSHNGLPLVPAGRNAVGGGVRATDERSSTFLLVEASCLGTFHGVQGGDGARVSCSPSTDTAWESNGLEIAFGNHSPQRVAMCLQDGLPDRWGNVEFTYRGVSGTGSDADGNAGSFLSPAYPRYLHHIRGGKPIPPTVPLMWHVGALVCTEQEAPCHCLVS